MSLQFLVTAVWSVFSYLHEQARPLHSQFVLTLQDLLASYLPMILSYKNQKDKRDIQSDHCQMELTHNYIAQKKGLKSEYTDKIENKINKTCLC